MKKLFIILYIVVAGLSFAQSGIKIGRLKYHGGGDWYNDRSAEINLLHFVKEKLNLDTEPEYNYVEIGSAEMFSYPVLFITGHGTIKFSDSDIQALKDYINKGGFIYADDDYGMDKSFRKEIKRVFPEKELVELPFNHEIYHIYYDFFNGPPKIHEHDNKPPKGYGIFVNNRLALYYTYESNPSDGWADPDVHNDPPYLREKALQFGLNIILYAVAN